jgi:hypothetical protein
MASGVALNTRKSMPRFFRPLAGKRVILPVARLKRPRSKSLLVAHSGHARTCAPGQF